MTAAEASTLREQLDTLPWIDGRKIEDRGMTEHRDRDGRPVRYRVGEIVDAKEPRK